MSTEKTKQALLDLENSVKTLADNLPQWNSEDKTRVVLSALSSLFEEAGELCGLVSKYRIRKQYFNADPKSFENFNDIRNKFIDESGDFLWVLICSMQRLLPSNEVAFLNKLIFDDSEKYNLSLETALFDIIRDVSILRQTLLFNTFSSFDKIINDFEYIIYSYKSFLLALASEYDITLLEIITYNMNKLGNRYTSDGTRTDGK